MVSFGVDDDDNGIWEYNVTDLNKFGYGHELGYTLETVIIDGYSYEIDGHNIKYIHTPEKTEVSGLITWDDGDNADGIRPESDSNADANIGTPTQMPASGSNDAAITISKKVSGLETTAKKTAVTISWDTIKQNKKTKKIWKIQIQISTDKTFQSNVKTKNIGKKNTATVIKGLARKTTYYIRTRYLDGNGGASNWSKSQKIRTK